MGNIFVQLVAQQELRCKLSICCMYDHLLTQQTFMLQKVDEASFCNTKIC